jgi:hypothetical protein
MNKNVKEIFSTKVKDEFDGFIFEFDVYVDNETGAWWYAFMDVLNSINFSRKAGEKYYYEIDDCDKCNFYDKGFVNDYGENMPSERSFISYNALMNLLDRNFKRMNAFAKVVNKVYGYKEIKSSNDGIEEAVCNLRHCYDIGDLEGVFIEAEKLVNSEVGTVMLNKDKDKEEIIEQTDDQRQELIDAYDEGRLIEYKIRPKEESDGMILYKKHPNCHKESTCPSWLRSIVK